MSEGIFYALIMLITLLIVFGGYFILTLQEIGESLKWIARNLNIIAINSEDYETYGEDEEENQKEVEDGVQ